MHTYKWYSINKNSETRITHKTPDVLHVLLWPHHIHFSYREFVFFWYGLFFIPSHCMYWTDEEKYTNTRAQINKTQMEMWTFFTVKMFHYRWIFCAWIGAHHHHSSFVDVDTDAATALAAAVSARHALICMCANFWGLMSEFTICFVFCCSFITVWLPNFERWL